MLVGLVRDEGKRFLLLNCKDIRPFVIGVLELSKLIS